MEKIKASVPVDLLERIQHSSIEDLSVVCSTLVGHLTASTLFHQLLGQLVDFDATRCAKDSDFSSTWKHDGNAAFSSANFQQAIQCYFQALRYAPLHSEDDKVAAAVLYVNRAAAMHKLGLLEAVERDCTRALGLNPSNAKAWYRRARARAELKNLKESISDMRKALALERSAGGKRQVALELEQILADFESSQQNEVGIQEEVSLGRDELKVDGEMERVWTPDKGWGLHSKRKLKRGSLILVEDAYAAVEDSTARIFCELGQFGPAVQHCLSSIKILKELYNNSHIVVANEQLKLASIAIAAGNWELAKCNLTEANKIYMVHFGPNYAQKLSYVTKLWKLLFE